MKEYKYKINGTKYTVSVGDIDDNVAQVEVNGVPYTVELNKTKAAPVTVKAAAPRPAAPAAKPAAPKAPAAGAGAVKAPLPGVVISIPVKVGDTVKADDTIVILEAMKMENSIRAGRDGRVAAINVAAGDSVLEGTPLVTLE